MTWLIVGLGNPGPKYEKTKHNVGFRALDEFARACSAGAAKEKFKGVFAKGMYAGEETVLLKPLTFMNLSGESVQPTAAFFKVEPKQILVLHDELDLPFGDVRIKIGGGHAGHNGLRSMIQHLGTPDFVRVRIGIGRPTVGAVESWVLSEFGKMESAELEDVLRAASLAVESILKNGATAAQNRQNTRSAKK